MKKPLRILNLEPEGYNPQAHNILSSIGPVDLGPMDRKELIECLYKYNILIVRLGHLIDEEVLGKSGLLKIIASATRGLDHIYMDFAEEKGIQVVSLKNEYDFLDDIWATAEHTFGLILTLIRNTAWAVQSVLQGEWDRDIFRGVELHGKNLGILGHGRIGRKIAAYGRTFGMKVGILDRNKSKTVMDDQLICFEDLGRFLSFSQVLSIHVPLNEETRGMLGEKELMMLPQGAFLINTSRGGILEEMALLGALKKGHLGGAALDVLDNETIRGFLDKNEIVDYAKKNKNLIITPHIGGATRESMAKTEIFIAKKIKKFVEENQTIF